MEIIRSADGIFNKKSNGTDVIYYIFNEYEIHFNIISGNSIQEWHRHELLEEVIYVLFGSICIHWVEDDECKSITISKGDIARVEKNIHTLENDKNEAAEFLVFRLILDGIDKKTLIKNDKILVNEDPCKNEKKI